MAFYGVEAAGMCNLAMIIDDSLTVRKILEVTLQREGLIVLSFATGTEALHVLEMDPGLIPDVLFLDLVLPGMDGFTVLRLLRTHPRFDGTVIVILSRRDGMLDRLKSRLAGATVYLTKPFKTREIISIIALMRLAATRAVPMMMPANQLHSQFPRKSLSECPLDTQPLPAYVSSPVDVDGEHQSEMKNEYIKYMA
jgi:twitching motility two-component system response regulator PilG